MMNPMMMTERMGMPGMGMPGVGMPGTGGMTAPMMPNMMMVPRCTMKFEKMKGGMKIACTCDDQTMASMMQNLCSMLQGGMCSCCMMMNGMPVYYCNLTMGMCQCETSGKGCTVTCTSGDTKCAEMIQACCDCMATMLKDGCTCCMMLNGTPVCCSC
jgi:hypothetical protein